ncbi:hypothetical protein SDC9_67067 [bioreactor metagenome]|uniref:Uncharacterized protein n=1 Tax=bioreactor metagenome TaxID=1076179 RepID=A0A644XWK7_9ZZZZ
MAARSSFIRLRSLSLSSTAAASPAARSFSFERISPHSAPISSRRAERVFSSPSREPILDRISRTAAADAKQLLRRSSLFRSSSSRSPRRHFSRSSSSPRSRRERLYIFSHRSLQRMRKVSSAPRVRISSSRAARLSSRTRLRWK